MNYKEDLTPQFSYETTAALRLWWFRFKLRIGRCESLELVAGAPGKWNEMFSSKMDVGGQITVKDFLAPS